MSSARRLLLVALSSLLLVVVGCSDDGTGEPAAQSVAGAPSTAATSATSATSATTAARTAPATMAASPVQPEGFDLAPAEVTLPSGEVCVLCLWIAKTALQRQRGLMGVTDLGVADGMAFVYDEPTDGQFWMRDTPLPLSIAFFAGDGRFVSAEDMEPCLTGPAAQCARYSAARPYVTAIEVSQGGLAGLGIGSGSSLKLFTGSGCDAAGP